MCFDYWKLADDMKTPVKCTREEWGEFMKDHLNRRIALTHLDNSKVSVSTVFLALDHNHSGEGPPVLFETMIFGLPDEEEYQTRCCTWEEALRMHDDAVVYAKSHL